MSFDYSKLNGLIIEKCGSKAAYAKMMGLSERSVSLKTNGKRQWKPTEICKTCQILNIPEKEIPKYFFTRKVQNIEQIT